MIDQATAERTDPFRPSPFRAAPAAEFDTAALDHVLAAFFDATDLFTRTGPHRDTARTGEDGNGAPSSARRRRVTVCPSEVGGPGLTDARDPDADAAAYTIRSLLACQATTYRLWAARMGLKITDLSIEVVGKIDLAALLAQNPEVSAGLGRARVRICIDGPEDPARYHDLHAVVSEHGPVGGLSRPAGRGHAAQQIRAIPDQHHGALDRAAGH